LEEGATVATIFRQNPRTAGRVVDGHAFVVTPDDNKLHTLNGTGSCIWEAAEGGRTIDELAAALARRFAVDEVRARADAERFCADLVSRGILQREDPA
jgi:hypothetical protein